MRFTEKEKVFEFLKNNDYFKDKIFKLLEIENKHYSGYQINFQFIGEFGEIATATIEISEAVVDNFFEKFGNR